MKNDFGIVKREFRDVKWVEERANSPREFISAIFKERVLNDFWEITRQEEAFLTDRATHSGSSFFEDDNK